MTASDRPPGWALLSSTVAPLALIGGWLAAAARQPAGTYDPVRQTISALAGHAATDRWIMTTGLYLVGTAHLVTAAGLRGARPVARVVLALAGLATLGVASFPETRSGATRTHLAFAELSIGLLALFCVLLGDRSAGKFPLRPRDAAVVGVASLVLLAWVLQLFGGDTLGLSERVITGLQTLWPPLVVSALRRRTPGPHPADRSPVFGSRAATGRPEPGSIER